MKIFYARTCGFAITRSTLVAIIAVTLSCNFLSSIDHTNHSDNNGPVHQWEPMSGPNGLYVSDIAIKGDKTFVIAGDDLYISEDPEKPWVEYPTSAYGFKTIFAHGGRIFAGTTSGINVSYDNGSTWKRVLDKWPSGIQVISGIGSFMLAKGGGTLFSSSDSGNTWTQRSDGTEGQYSNVLLVVGDVALFTGKGYVQRTTDNLQTYTQGHLEDDTARVTALLEDKGTVYAFSTTEVSFSQDTGASWLKLGDIPQDNYKYSFAAWDDLLLIGTSNGLFISNDMSQTWSKSVLPFDTCRIVAIAQGTERILIGGEDGVFVSNNNGITWGRHNAGLAVDVYHLVAAEKNLIAGTWGPGIWLSEDRQRAWRRTPRSSLSSVFGMFYYQNRVYAGGWQSIDYGATWEYYSTERIYDFCASNGVLFGGTEGNGVITSMDYGKTWLKTSFDSKTVYNMLSVADRIFAATNSGWVRYSDDQGNTWTECKKEFSWYIDDWDTRNDTIFAAVSDSGLYFSPNKGISWQSLSTPYSSSSIISALKCTDSDIIVSSYRSGTVYRFNGTNAV